MQLFFSELYNKYKLDLENHPPKSYGINSSATLEHKFIDEITG